MELEVEVTDTEDMTNFLIDLFVEDSREGKSLEEELGNEIVEEEIKDKNDASEMKEENPEEVARFNNYMDAVFRRMNAALRAKLMDPMELNLNHKGKKDDDKKDKKEKKDGKTRTERELTEIEEEEEEDEESEMKDPVDRIGMAAEKKKGKKGKNKEMKDKKEKSKKKKGEAKKGEAKNNKKKGEKNNNKNKGEKKGQGQDPKVKAQKQAERQKKREEKRAMKKKEKEARKAGELSRGQRSKQSKEKHENSKNKDRKDKKNPKEKAPKHKGRENKQSEEEKAMGSLSGIATLRRSGDVVVQNEETHKVVTSVFTVGPLQLEVTKSLGHGKARTVKTAKATTDVMTGTMVLKVKPDGSAHVKKVVFKKPEHVDVKGSISDKKERSQNILKNSFNKSRPLAAQKILKTARYVLKGSSNTNHS